MHERPALTLAQRVLLARAARQTLVRVSSGYQPARALERRGLLAFQRGDVSEPGEQVDGASRFKRHTGGSSVLEYAITDAGRAAYKALRHE